VACNGPICRSNPSKEPVRNCKTCTHKFCKKCCVRFQKDGAAQCAHPSHDLDSKDAPGSSADVANPEANTSTEYNVKRPLRKDHYEAKENAQKKWETQSNRLILKRVAEDSLRSTVRLIFWKV